MVVGKIIKISGPVVVAEGMKGSQMFEVVKVGRITSYNVCYTKLLR